VDVSQIVNDAAEEWIQMVSAIEQGAYTEQLSDERLIGLLASIVEKRTLDAIRSLNAWKRGGHLEAVGSEHLQQCTDPHCSDCLSEMQSSEMRSLLDMHLDSIQQQVLDLRCYGYSETEIAERMQITSASVQRIRKSIAAVAKAINLTRDERRETRDERRETKDERRKTKDERRKTKDEKIVSENGNFPAGTGADYDWFCSYLVRSSELKLKHRLEILWFVYPLQY
jgi:DNA-binding NarL/FixJ family response regulator